MNWTYARILSIRLASLLISNQDNSISPLVPCFNDEIEESSGTHRRRSGGRFTSLKGLRNKSNNLMNVARGVFYKDFIYKLEQWQPEEAFLGNEETAWRCARYLISSF